MLRLQDLRRSSINKMSSSGRVITSSWQLLSCAMNRLRHTDEWHIDQNMLEKLTEMVKDEEVATRFVNGSWHKLINKIDEGEYRRKLDGLKMKWQRRPDFLHYLFNTWLNPLAHKFCRLWLSMCHGDSDTVFLNIDSLIEGQIAEIKRSLEISNLKEKYGAKSNPILKNISNNINHLALKKIWLEIKRAREIVDDPQNKKLEIGVDIPTMYERDMDFKMRDLTSMLEEICMGPILKVREVRRLIKGVISLVLLDDPGALLTTLPRNGSHERKIVDKFNKSY
ncbi:hypothetical protein M9H77_35416 [Catharanthus roseus]|uniref:Uncharacterized protein n=1 Tax=Catharanthus roseus TaxID=4058 RepID=A0ACB9ZQ87_CATRO|nr:hypothetical protein M9H77_35416 [Catharanthus roseus]